jgi:hypothetical protein
MDALPGPRAWRGVHCVSCPGWGCTCFHGGMLCRSASWPGPPAPPPLAEAAPPPAAAAKGDTKGPPERAVTPVVRTTAEAHDRGRARTHGRRAHGPCATTDCARSCASHVRRTGSYRAAPTTRTARLRLSLRPSTPRRPLPLLRLPAASARLHGDSPSSASGSGEGSGAEARVRRPCGQATKRREDVMGWLRHNKGCRSYEPHFSHSHAALFTLPHTLYILSHLQVGVHGGAEGREEGGGLAEGRGGDDAGHQRAAQKVHLARGGGQKGGRP